MSQMARRSGAAALGLLGDRIGGNLPQAFIRWVGSDH